MSDQIVQGRAYTDIEIALVKQDETEFPLAGSTVTFTASQGGVPVLVQSITIDVFGTVTVSDGLALGPDGVSAGVVLQSLSAIETAALPRGWVDWTVTVTDGLGNVNDAVCGRWLVTTTYACTGGVTRRMLRRMILGEVGDLKLLKATADGANVTFFDTTNLIGENNTYIDRQAYFSGGTVRNLEEVRHVVGSSRDQRNISFGLALPEETHAGDVVELVNMRGTGYQIADVHQALDTALLSARKTAFTPVTQTMGAYSRSDGSLAIPHDWVLVSAIQWQDDSGAWRPIRISSRAGGDGWSIDRFARVVEVGGTWGYRIDGATVRLAGAVAPSPLTHDDDSTNVSTDWLKAEAVAILLQGSYLRHPTQERRDLVFQAQQKANGLRPLVVNRLPPNAVTL